MGQIPEITVETFQSGGLSEGEARVHALRLQGLSQTEIAQEIGREVGTVKSYCSRIDGKGVTLPNFARIEGLAANKTASDEGRAHELVFENGARIRYVWKKEKGEIVEEMFRADDPDSVYNSTGFRGTEGELAGLVIEKVDEYLENYMENPEACREERPHVFEAVTLLPA